MVNVLLLYFLRFHYNDNCPVFKSLIKEYSFGSFLCTTCYSVHMLSVHNANKFTYFGGIFDHIYIYVFYIKSHTKLYTTVPVSITIFIYCKINPNLLI